MFDKQVHELNMKKILKEIFTSKRKNYYRKDLKKQNRNIKWIGWIITRTLSDK